MKNPIDSAMFIDSFDFLATEYKFIRKGTLFIRLVNDEIIQTVYLFKIDPISFDINIGLFSVCEDVYPGEYKEGITRLSELAFRSKIHNKQYTPSELGDIRINDAFWITEPLETLLRARHAFIEIAVPVFEDVTNLKKLMEFKKTNGLYSWEDIFLANIKLGDMQEAFKALKRIEKDDKEGVNILTRSILNNENTYSEESLISAKSALANTQAKMRAIENNDTDFLNAILDKTYMNSKKMLLPYGIILK
jgi:hypothetical protein